MFVDQVKVTLRAGKGGNGCMSFRRERRVPRGGPDGGRGGDGGNIYLVSEENLSSLTYFRFYPINKAQKGAHGEGGNRQGKNGEDLLLRVPVGTLVRKKEKKEILFDFLSPGQKFLIVKGGKGGRGNAAFATSTYQAPRDREEGRPGEEGDFVLELKLIADIGLIGFPNVGKSTLISKISAAKPVIADYPFTTLIPNLGVVDVGEFNSFVIADIPGLIEGAHQGHGLGIKFLKHVERTKILLHLIDVSPYTERDPVQDFRTVMTELEAFSPQLSKRYQILAANKIDLLGENKERLDGVKKLAKKEKLPFFAISAQKKEGLRKLVNEMYKTLNLIGESTD
ncbi:MAG: GTPase ObgE [Candidatus Aminicenantes bacterium]|nr:GTPase ObgE [Candidatus Aminicenantes bacterium]MBL7083415.1 GTPase ObgE [Candidatus Aminicenantes bacterium]